MGTITTYKVDDDFTGQINLAGAPKAYTGGDLIVLDSDDAEERALVDLGVHDLSNKAARDAAIDALIEAGDLHAMGTVSDGGDGDLRTWSVPVTLADLADGEVARIKPGFAGRVTGFLFASTADATTSGKAATLGLEIDPGVVPGSGDEEDTSDGKVLLTRTGSPTGGNFDLLVSIDGGDDVAVDDVTYNSTVNAFQTLVDATDLAGLVVVGGSAGAWTLTAANASIEVTVDSGDLTGGTSPAVTPTDVTVGGGSRIVGAEGDPATLGLTSANVTDGGIVAGETIATGSDALYGNFGAEDEIVLKASAVTAFAEGAGVVTVYLLQV